MTGGDVYRALWRHKFLIAVLTAVFVGAAWYVTSRQARRYEASTLIRVQEQGSRAGDASTALAASQTLTLTYAQIVDAGALKPQIQTLVAGCNSGKPARLEGFLPGTAGAAGALSTGGTVPAATPNPRKAAAARKNLGKSYATACNSIGVTPRLPAAPTKISKVHLSASPVQDLDLLSIGARSRSRRHATIAANSAPWALRAFIQKSGSRSEKIVIVKPAIVPGFPISRQLPLKLTIALMVALIFNGALALLVEFFRDRLPEPEQLGHEVGVPVLATIPTLQLHRVASLEDGREASAPLSIPQSGEAEEQPRTVDRVGDQ